MINTLTGSYNTGTGIVTLHVTLGTPMSGDYAVFAKTESASTTQNPPSVWVSAKTSTGFTLEQADPGNLSLTVDWMASPVTP